MQISAVATPNREEAKRKRRRSNRISFIESAFLISPEKAFNRVSTMNTLLEKNENKFYRQSLFNKFYSHFSFQNGEIS